MTVLELVPLGCARPCCSLSSPIKPRHDTLEALKSIRPQIQKICEVSGVVGASIVVIDHGESIFQENLGYRDLATKERVTSDTIFPIASLTKSFTGACINKLRAEKRLSLDDLIHKHLPEAKSRDPVVASIATIADLLGHRTGLQGADRLCFGSDGQLLLDQDQTAAVFSQLRTQASLRSCFIYNNLGYATLGEIITEVSGLPYPKYLEETILAPLGMNNTILSSDRGLPYNTSRAYYVMENGEPWNVPLPGVHADGALGSAGGLLSCANDLILYYKALMRSWSVQVQNTVDYTNNGASNDLFDDITWLFAPLQIMEMPSFREKSYAAGWVRSQLPTTVGDIGVNPAMIEKMPLLAEGIESRLALWHQGSLIGGTSFVMLLPETESAVLVLTNTTCPNDAADWIGQLLVETLLNSPVRHDYVHLASLSTRNAFARFSKLMQDVEYGRGGGNPARPFNEYAGSYIGVGGTFRIDIVDTETGLHILFQGRHAHEFQLQHHHDDTFTWFSSWNDHVRRAKYIEYQPSFYFLHFVAEDGKGISTLNWVHDPPLTEGETFVKQ